MRSGHWRRWRPSRGDVLSSTALTSLELFVRVKERLKRVDISKRHWRKYRDFTELNNYINGARGHATGLGSGSDPSVERAEAWLYALALQAPRAAVAQEEISKRPHGYHNKAHRVYELIDFNDAFDWAILALPRDLLPSMDERIKALCDFMCNKAGTRFFSDDEYKAIVRGLSREIAVFIGLENEGYHVEMASRHEDAFGIDMTVLSPKNMKQVALDVKTRSSYHYRIQQLRRQGRLSEEDVIMAERNGFTSALNGRGSEQRRVVTWRIDHETLGDVVDFQFKDTKILSDEIQTIIFRYGE